jgi:AcrR family transcriptional regulator
MVFKALKDSELPLTCIIAKVLPQTIYSHFQDKEGIFKAVIERITINRYQQIFISEFSNSAQPTEPSVFLLQLANTYFSKVASDSDYLSLLRVVIGESARFPELAKLYAQTMIHSGRKLLTEYFDSLPELNLGDAEYMAHIFMGSLVSFIVVQEIMHTQEIVLMSSEQLVSNLIGLFLSKSDNKLIEVKDCVDLLVSDRLAP